MEKTTLLNAIGGLDKVNNGKIYINGKKITRKTSVAVDKIRNLNIGYIFQDYKLIDNMSVFDNVAISLKMIGIKNKKEVEKRVNYVLEAVGMYRYRNRPSKMLSGGEKQRVAIARAIVKNPSIVIADEPTGNLDSKNSLEIMNIIKAISKEKLVILVTQEVDLARFYATRIVELQDGKIIKDTNVESNENLDYRVENIIYLKDFENINTLKNENVNIDIYSDKKDAKINVKLVLKNGNIYIQSKERKIEVVDENSSIELINEHYKKIDKTIYEKYNYDLNKVIDDKYIPKYSSIYGIVKSIKNGFNRILNYTILKKLLLVGFFSSAMFVVYSICNMAGARDIRESDYVKLNKNYLQVDMMGVNVEDYIKYEQLEDIDYIIPGDSYASFNIKMNNYYQTSRYSFDLTGSLVDIDKIDSTYIINGRMPENDYELVVDKKVIDNLLNDDFSYIKAMGIKTEDEFIDRIVTIEGMKDFKIVGIVDNLSESIYVNKAMFINILNLSSKSILNFAINMEEDINEENSSETQVKDYTLYLDDITITKGREPLNDYEVIVNKDQEELMKLNKTINEKVNDRLLTVVGYYDSKTKKHDFLVNNNTVKYKVISYNNGFVIYPKDKESVLNKFKNDYHINIVDRYEKDKNDYLEEKKNEIRSATIFAGIILAISLIEIYLMIRSSFLSRIKEVGVYRAIGVKKGDIYRMFLGEILSITMIASIPGITFMTYILTKLSKMEILNRMFIVNTTTVGLSFLIVILFNIIVGLLPLYRVIVKTPASILARHDLE